MSKLTFFSVGIAAENKALDSDTLEVSPVEELPLLDGEITTDTQTLEATATNKDDQSYSAKTYATNTVPAMWLPFCNGNRVSSPDIRRGAVVMLWQMGDEKKYYWTTLKNDLQLRKLETVIYAFSATQSEAATVDGENYYYLEISTHKKLVTFHTSKANGEPFTYDFQLNTEQGTFLIRDDIDNSILIDSKNKQIRMESALGTYFEIVGKDINIHVEGDYNLEVLGSKNEGITKESNEEVGSTKSISSKGNTFTAPTNTMDAPDNQFNGNFSVSAGNGQPGDGTIQGKFHFTDSITVEKDVSVLGILTARKLISQEAIEAPNV